MPDVFRLCNAFIPNPEQIIACLQQNVSALSSACRVATLRDAPAEWSLQFGRLGLD